MKTARCVLAIRPSGCAAAALHFRDPVWVESLTHTGSVGIRRLDPSKISGVGTNFGLLLHVLPEPNKRRVCKHSLI